MRITGRDIQLVRDVVMSRVLSRDQIMASYFGSRSRANERLHKLVEFRALRVHSTPFFTQHLYVPGPAAQSLVGDAVARHLDPQRKSPRFLQHSLMVTEVRLKLKSLGITKWYFEPQLWARFSYGGKEWQVRPDGLALTESRALVIEVDMGHMEMAKIRAKLRSYCAFLRSGESERQWSIPNFQVLFVTPGKRRARSLNALRTTAPELQVRAVTLEQLSIDEIGAWS